MAIISQQWHLPLLESSNKEATLGSAFPSQIHHATILPKSISQLKIYLFHFKKNYGKIVTLSFSCNINLRLEKSDSF